MLMGLLRRFFMGLALLTTLSASTLINLSYAKDAWPSQTFPDTLGTQIHFKDPNHLRDLDMLQAEGIKLVRLDIPWWAIEHVRGQYEFSQFDPIINGLAQRGIRCIAPVNWGNIIYGANQRVAVTTPEAQRAFAAYAAALAKHYRGRHMIFEIWNEPNLSNFWPSPATMDDYMRLVKVVSAALRKADPDVLIVAPALANTITPSIVHMMELGLLNEVDGISIHPYQQQNPPEHGDYDLKHLKQYLTQYGKPNMPIAFTEWGYSVSPSKNVTAALQAQYLVREALLGQMYGVVANVLYEWQNHSEPCRGGNDDCFGMVGYYLDKRPAYYEIQRLTQTLKGYHFTKRLPSQEQDYYLVFARPHKPNIIAAWTTLDTHASMVLPDKTVLKLSGLPTYHLVK